MASIKWTKSNIREAWRTPQFGNLLSDTYQGEVDQDSDGKFSGWMMNLSRSGHSKFRFGFGSRGAATRWVNQQLREVGVR